MYFHLFTPADEKILFGPLFISSVVILGIVGVSAHQESVRKRFSNPRFAVLWSAAKDRLERYHETLRKMRRDHIGGLEEMERTVNETGQGLYLALRRADLTLTEIAMSEQGMLTRPQISLPISNDSQAQELYRIADKNLADYRSQLQAVLSSVQRAEAQAAVFTTTLDTMRMKMLGFRLAGKRPEMSTQAFLEAMTEAKMQLNAIDDSVPYPNHRHPPGSPRRESPRIAML
jgi:hypothetical protein